MLQSFIVNLINMSITAGIIIVAVILVRLLLRKAPKVFSYALWGIVLLRLLCPISFSSQFSMFNLLDVETGETGAMQYILQSEDINVPAANWEPTTIVANGYATGGGEANKAEAEVYQPFSVIRPDMQAPQTSVNEQEKVTVHSDVLPEEVLPAKDHTFAAYKAVFVVWIVGVFVLVTANLASLVRLRRKLATSMPLQGNVYLSDEIATPFCLGILRAKIFLPSTLGEQERGYILLHEKYHIRRCDHVIKLFAFLALCIHWFNPLVWLAFVLAGKDMEMSCDEAVMRQMDADIRAEYSTSLLHLATGRRFAPSPLSFGEGNPKDRIKNIMNYKKPAFWIIAVGIVVCVGVAVVLGTNPKKTEVSDGKPEESVSADDSSVADTVHTEDTKPVPISLGEGTAIYSLPYNGDDKNSLKYYEAYGEWLRPLGLCSFEVSDGKLFVDDSVNERVAVVEGSGAVSYIPMPAGYVCKQMKYVSDQEKLVMLLEDNLAIEPQNLWIKMRKTEEQDPSLIEADLIKADLYSVLTADGTTAPAPQIDYRGIRWNQYINELHNYLSVAADEGHLIYMDQHLDYQLWKYKPINSDLCSYFITCDGQIVAYTQLLSGQSDIGPRAILREKDGVLSICWLELVSKNELVIKESAGVKTVIREAEKSKEPLLTAATIIEANGLAGTRFMYDGQIFDIADRVPEVNAITSYTPVDKYLIVEGHIGPYYGAYCIFNIETKEFERDIIGACPIWHDEDITTLVYEYWGSIRDYEGTVISRIEMEDGSYIRQLRFAENYTKIEVSIETATGYEKRVVDRNGVDYVPVELPEWRYLEKSTFTGNEDLGKEYYFLIEEKLTEEPVFYRTSEASAEKLLNALCAVPVNPNGRWSDADKFYLLLWDAENNPVCLIEVWEDTICINQSKYYKVSGDDLYNMVKLILEKSKKVEPLTKEEVLLNHAKERGYGEFAKEDILWENGTAKLLVESGYRHQNDSADEQVYYETYIFCSGFYFDKYEGAAYGISESTFMYDDDTVWSSDTAIVNCYDMFTGEKVDDVIYYR